LTEHADVATEGLETSDDIEVQGSLASDGVADDAGAGAAALAVACGTGTGEATKSAAITSGPADATTVISTAVRHERHAPTPATRYRDRITLASKRSDEAGNVTKSKRGDADCEVLGNMPERRP
jgi:hypothetical protein